MSHSSSSKQFLFPAASRNGTTIHDASLIGPETINGSIDYNAFSTDKTPLYLGLFPHKVINELKDQTNVDIRRAAINKMHAIIQELNDKVLLIDNLQDIVSLLTPLLNDINFKIVLTALEFVDDLVDKSGSSLLPFLSVLLSNYIDKVGSHKYVVKQAGMKVLLHMMLVLSPTRVINEILDIGIQHAQAKVREETLNIIIASLLTFSKSDFSLPYLIERVTPLLTDCKQKVRQACLEVCAVLADRLGREQLQSLLTAIITIQLSVTSTNTENLHVAFQSRLSRQQLPQLNKDGLVDHVVNVANGKDPGDLSGSDVDWILAGKGTSPGTSSRKQTTGGPLRSAGKKLPWDKETGYGSMALKQGPTKSSNGLGGPSGMKAKGYSDIYKTSTVEEQSRQHVPAHIATLPTSFKLGKSIYTNKGSTPSGGHSIVTASLSITWPRQNNYGSSNHLLKCTSRQISADNSILAGNLLGPARLPAIGSNRPSSKPIVRNPLPFHPQPPPHLPSHSPPLVYDISTLRADSPTVIEESFLTGGEDDADYFNIPVDDSQLNSSLSSSLTSLLFGRDTTIKGERTRNETHTVDSLSQIRKKAANWKAEILSVQCSTSTSPCDTPPLMRQEVETVSAPLKRHSEAIPFIHSPSYRIDGLIPHRESEPSLVYRRHTTELTGGQMKSKLPQKMFKSPPLYQLIERPSEPLHVNDLEANPEFISPPKSKDTTIRKIKKIIPSKAASAPQKSTAVTLSGSSTSNSAPVYRLGLQEPLDEEPANRVVELSPLINPEAALRKALEGLGRGTEEWEEKCDSLILLRRLSACHINVIIPQLQNILTAVEKEVRNLRSQVARNAIACLGDMFGYLGKDMEVSLDAIVKTLLHVGSKSNTFYKEDTEKALYEMCSRILPSKSLQALMNGGLTHGSQLIRRQVAYFMFATVEYHGPAKIIHLPRDVLDRVIHAISLFLRDADPQARYQARKMLSQLYLSPEFDTLASKVLVEHQLTKMREISEHIKVKGIGKPPLDSQSARTTRLSISQVSSTASNGLSPPKLRKRRSSASNLITTPSVDTTDINVVMDIVTKMKASDWKERQEAINDLEQLIMSNPISLGSCLVKVFDVFNERLCDKNSKVNLYALQAFERFVPLLNHQLQPILATLVEVLAGTVASRYPAIHSAALNAIDTLISTVDSTLLFPPFALAAQNGNARVQPIMLKKIADLIPQIYDQKPSLVQRVGLPVLWKILSSRSPATGEAKMAVLKLTEALHICLGPNLIASAAQLSPSQQHKLHDLLHVLQNR